MKKVSHDKKNDEEKIIPSKEGEKIQRDKLKTRGLGRFKKSFGYSVEGLKYAYKYEQSMLIHFIFTVCVLAINVALEIGGYIGKEVWWVSFLAIGMVLASELINTAIEACVDMVTLEYNPLAKIAKDCGSAATFVLAVMAGAIGIAIYGPIVLEILGF